MTEQPASVSEFASRSVRESAAGPVSAAAPRRVAVVTGGSRGIGRESAERLAADGLAVVVT